MKAYKSIYDLPADRQLKAFLGTLLTTVNPSLAERVRAAPFTQPLKYHERLVRNACQQQAISQKDHEMLHRFLVDYWSSPFSKEFFSLFSNRYEDLFLKYHRGIVDALSEEVSAVSNEEDVHLVELGCGDGKVLNHLSENLAQLSSLTGFDLSEDEISNCKQRYSKNAKVKFSSEDIFQWLERQKDGPLVLYTNGGVLEYFTRKQLVSLFSLLRRRSNHAWVALTETLATDHCLESEGETFPYGQEIAFSHNYPDILKECGFTVKWKNDRYTKSGEENHPTRWLQIVAQT